MQRAIVRFEQRGDYNDNERIGRPKLLTERDLRVLKRLAIGTAHESNRGLAIQLSEATEKIVSARTVRRSLAELGYEYKVGMHQFQSPTG